MADFDVNDAEITDYRDLGKEESCFRIKNQRLFLTYKTHILKDYIRTFFTGKAKKDMKDKIEIYIAHETGDINHGYDHTHVYINFGYQFQSKLPRAFDIDGIHPNIGIVKTTKHVENIYKYLAKEDKSNSFLLEKISKCVAEKVWNCKTKTDAFKLASKPSDAAGISILYDNKPAEKEIMDIIFREWQAILEKELGLRPDDRRVIWYVDNIGGSGKSYYCRYRKLTHGDLVLTDYTPRDVATIFKNALERSSWIGNVVLVDIPRGKGNNFSDLYVTMEMIKNGMITAPKYQSETVCFNSPHLVIFSNFPPDVTKMSADRWSVRTISQYNAEEVTDLPTPPVPISVPPSPAAPKDFDFSVLKPYNPFHLHFPVPVPVPVPSLSTARPPAVPTVIPPRR